jgi:tellurite resistance-related uncharacterized protein
MGQGMPFANSTHSLTGKPQGLGKWATLGELKGAEVLRFMEDSDATDYIVFSYETPIAWHTPAGWYMVEQKFSQTTSCHQGQVRRAIAEIEKPRTVVCAPSPAVLSELMRMA